MKNEQTLWGVPIDEARRVIEVYKCTHKMPSKDYQEGFEDGVKYMCEGINKCYDEIVQNYMEKENETN